MLIAHFDGSTRKTTEGIKSGIGFVVKDTLETVIVKKSRSIKGCSSYKAEYTALLELCHELKKLKPMGMVIIKGDSESIITHVNELYKDPTAFSKKAYWNIAKECVKILRQIPKCHFHFMWVKRVYNKEADLMSGKASGKYRKHRMERWSHDVTKNRTTRRIYEDNGPNIQVTEQNNNLTKDS